MAPPANARAVRASTHVPCIASDCESPKQKDAAVQQKQPTKDVEEEDESPYCCRICFEDDKPSALLSPCKCKGSLAYVHAACLQRWQAQVLKMGSARDERAYVCGVCRSRYTLRPAFCAHAASLWWRRLGVAARAAACAACVTFLALSLSGPPLVHVMLLLLLLLSVRSQALAVALVLAATARTASLYARSLRPLGLGLMHEDAVLAGFAGPQVMHHSHGGAPVQGLRRGVLLVASERLSGGEFGRSVVLLYDHGPHGAQGVLLTQPVDALDGWLWDRQLTDHLPTPGLWRHHLGGPVGAPPPGALAGLAAAAGAASAGAAAAAGAAAGRGPHIIMQVLHQFSGVAGAKEVLSMPPPAMQPPRPPASDHAAANTTSVAAEQASPVPAQQQHSALAQRAAGRRPKHPITGAAAAVFSLFAAVGKRRHPPHHPQHNSRTSHVAPPADGPPGPWSAQGERGAPLVPLYMGGSVDELLALLQALPAARAPPPPPHTPEAAKRRRRLHELGGGQARSARHEPPLPSQHEQLEPQQQRPLLHVFHGVCAWARGQLEAEVRARAWGFAPATHVDVLSTPPSELWQRLRDSGRVRWL